MVLPPGGQAVRKLHIINVSSYPLLVGDDSDDADDADHAGMSPSALTKRLSAAHRELMKVYGVISRLSQHSASSKTRGRLARNSTHQSAQG